MTTIKCLEVIDKNLVFRPFYVGEIVKIIDFLFDLSADTRYEYIGKQYIVCELNDNMMPVFNLVDNHDKRIRFGNGYVVERTVKLKRPRTYISV